MAYTVLARKYRSRGFDEIVGQDAVATTLKNAVASGRIHHGYLFTGTRGVGKTSMARILAKALNCLKADAPTAQPCCECEACRLIAEGEDIDVVEIDAASNTGVDNIRDLRSNAVYRPARSRFKIYIIDEVHMLSTGAFNALLKTLEEPPAHVKFILATTEAHRVPATIQSRCQRFDFRSISVGAICGRLWEILRAESIEADEAVVRRVARLASGSMRDALSLLDQLMAFGGSRLSAEILDEVLPAPHDELIFQTVQCIAARDAAGALVGVDRCFATGHTAERVCDTLIEHLRTLMLLRVCGPQTDLVDVPAQVREQLIEQSRGFGAATYVYMISLCEEVRRAVKGSRSGRALLDAAVVRLAHARDFSDVQTLLDRLEGHAGEAAPQASKKKEPPADRPVNAGSGAGGTSVPKPPTAVSDAAAPQGRPEPVPAVPQPLRAGVATAEKERVMASPLVRRALTLTNGSLIGVRPVRVPIVEMAGGDVQPSHEMDEGLVESSESLLE